VFRVAFVGLVTAIIFGVLGMIPVIGPVFLVVATIGITVAGVCFIIGLIKALFWF